MTTIIRADAWLLAATVSAIALTSLVSSVPATDAERSPGASPERRLVAS